ncbi:fibronectin type III domain-containing protein, partial [Siccationidurans soli]|nr:fibronectin type III domain-containing protein [Hymenobacter negativus]
MLLPLLALSFGSLEAQAQITIPATNPNTTSSRKPYGNYYGFERSAIIYSAGEVNGSGTITAIGFYLNAASSAAATPAKIYLKTTSNSAFTATGTTVAAEETGATLVYNATIPAASFAANSWVTVTLATPFAYAGTSNLEVIVEANGGGSGTEGSTAKTFRHNTIGGANSAQYWETDTSAPTGNGTTANSRPNIRLTGLTPLACAAPTALTAGSITTTTTSLSFTAGASNTSYTVTYTPTGGTATTVTPAPTASPVALTGLTPSTTYSVSVIGNCSGGTTSAAAATTFTTLTPPPANDECATATAIPSIGVGTYGTAVNGTNVSAT